MGILYSKYESIQECIILYNSKGKIKYINTPGLSLFKYPKDIKPKTVFELMEKNHRDGHMARMSRSKGMFNKDIRGVCYDGSTISIDITIIPKYFDYSMLIIKHSSSEFLHEYKTFFNLSNNGMFISKDDGIIVHCNSNFANTIEYSQEEIVGKNFLDLVYEKDLEKTVEAMASIKIYTTIDRFSNRYVTKSGKIINISWKVIEKNEKYYGTAENITDKIEALENLEKSKMFLTEIEELAMVGSWEWCIETGELSWSNGLRAIYELKDVSYESYMACNHIGDRGILQETIRKCLEDKKKYTIVHRLISHETKKLKWLKSIGRYISKNDMNYIIGVAQDITEQHNIEENYKSQKEIAEESSKIKSSFVASVSHEIRTPLNSIVGMVSLLNTTLLTTKQTKYISILQNSCGVLLSIINNILDFSKIESGKISLDMGSFNVRELVSKTIEIFRLECQKKGLELLTFYKFDTENIYSDEVKIRQIITNILSNAIKFTHIGSITINISCYSEVLSISIADTGIGISDDFLKKISTPFTQADSGTTRNYGGSGLGLSIVSSYVDLIGGKMKISSKQGIGSEVIMTIPVKEKDNSSRVIVIVEDNFANQYILKEMINRITDYSILCFDNGKSVVDNISTEPSLILMDIHMPRMDGHEATRNLRKRGFTCPIVALTANNIPGEELRCRASGMDAFVIKPINMEKIKDVIDKYIKLK